MNDNYRGLICPAGKVKYSPKLPPCNNNKIINERKIIARINGYLQQMLEQNTVDVFGEQQELEFDAEKRLQALLLEISELENQARILIRRQASTGEDLQSLYDEELNQINARLRNMRATRAGLQAQTIADQQTTTLQQVTL